jgi:hypothetical protein
LGSSGLDIDSRYAKKKKGSARQEKIHHDGTAIIDLRLDAADNDPDIDTGGARGEGRIVFSFSSEAEPDEL